MSDNKTRPPIPIDDLFLIWSELREIASSVAELLGTDKATPHVKPLHHFGGNVVEWSEQYADVQKTRTEWEKKRSRHELRIFRTPHLQDKKMILRKPGACFVQFALRGENGRFFGVMRGWFPARLDYDNAPPEPCLPLPPSADPPTLRERFAALAAIHDCFGDARHKIDPWAWANDDDSIPIKGYTKWIVPHASRYAALKHVVEQCENSESWPWIKDYEPTEGQRHNNDTLSAWIEEIREDLHSSVAPAPRGADPQGEGDGGDGANAGGADEQIREYITLDQAAALIQRSKRTLEDYLAQGKLPKPDVQGGHGRSNEWLYDSIRPALEEISGRKLPAQFPASRLPQIHQ